MDDGFVNELFTKIEVLEVEKASTEARLTSLSEQVAKLEIANNDLMTQNENLRALVKTKMDSTASIHEEIKMMDPPALKRMTTTMDERFNIVTIDFKPEVSISENDTVSIMGEFTNWLPEIMERYESQRVLLEPELANLFFYTTKLFVGFKYRYNFSVGDQFVVDSTKEVSEDRFGKATNFVEVHPKSAKAAALQPHTIEEEKLELDDVIMDLEGEGNDTGKEDVQANESANDLSMAKNALFANMPSYVNTEMNKVLPKDIVSKQGVRVMDQSSGSLCALLKKHSDTAEDISDL